MTKSNLTVYVADPCFDHKGLSTPVIPLGAGLVASYAQKHLPHINAKVFKAITPLIEGIKAEKPDVIGLTNYIWNKNLALAIAAYAKSVNPNTLIVFGGPEIDSQPYDLSLFVRKYQDVDIFVQHEGESAFAQIIEKYIDLGQNKSKLQSSIGELGNAFYIGEEGNIVEGPKLPRIDLLDDIPSPYMTGLFDQFLGDSQYMPMIQTNRGCPFSCTFCQEGESYFTKVKKHSQEFVFEELDYIAARVDSRSGLWITDSNWAMYKWDEEIAEHIAKIQAETGWPTEIISSTGKANLDRIIKITKTLNHTMFISNSVQSMNTDVLKQVKRKNLDPVQLEENKEELKGIRQEPEIIVPLPNETKDTFFKGLNQLLDSAPNQRFAVFQTLLLTNTEMAHDSAIKKYDFKVKHKQHYNLIGEIDGKFVCETERVVAATNTMTTDELCECLTYSMLIDALVRFEPLHEIFRFLESKAIPYSCFVQKMYDTINDAPIEIRNCVEDFKRDFLEQMHEDEESVISYMQENEEQYEKGRKGGGSLKYSNMFWIDYFELTFNWVFDSLKSIVDRSEDTAIEIENIYRYLSCGYADRFDQAPSNEELSEDFDFHVKYWSESVEVLPLSTFKGNTAYAFQKTPVSGIDHLTLWQNFGFKLDMGKKRILPGYTNRLFIAKLRRNIETLNSAVADRGQDGIERHWVGKLAL